MINKWTKRYLDMARQASTWSKDPSTKIGAIAIGSKGQILSTGYNGFARGIRDTEQRYNNKEEKYKYVIHGEMNAIYNACLNGVSLEGSTLYVYGLPVCSECANGIIQVGIKKVVIQCPIDINDKWKDSFKLTKKKFSEAEIPVLIYDNNYESISI